MLHAIIYLVAAFFAALLLFTMVYHIILYSDLEMDYINPIDICKKLNRIIFPEMILHVVLTGLFLFSFNILSFLINLPVCAYNFYRYTQHDHRLEPTDIFRILPLKKREGYVKLGFYLCSFFFYLFSMVISLL